MPEGSACETSNLNPAQARKAEGRCDGEGSPENRAPAAVRAGFPSTRELSVALSAASGWKGGFRHPDGVITRDLDVDAPRSGRAFDLHVIPQRTPLPDPHWDRAAESRFKSSKKITKMVRFVKII